MVKRINCVCGFHGLTNVGYCPMCVDEDLIHSSAKAILKKAGVSYSRVYRSSRRVKYWNLWDEPSKSVIKKLSMIEGVCEVQTHAQPYWPGVVSLYLFYNRGL